MEPLDGQEPPRRRYVTSRNYVFTCFDEHWHAPDPLDEKVRYVVYQLESSPTTDRRHLQGYVELTTSMRLKAVQKLLCLPVDTHMEARRGTRDEARAYCMKEATRVPGSESGPWEHGKWITGTSGNATAGCKTEAFIEYVTDPTTWKDEGVTKHALITMFPSIFGRMPNLFAYGWDYICAQRVPQVVLPRLYEWEVDMVRLLRPPRQMRRIFWIWSERSATGKSTFIQYLASTAFIGKVLVAPWDLRSLMYMYEGHHIIAFNMPRDVHEEFMVDRSYLATLERISDGGWMASSKYQASMKYVNAHVIVTANVPPPYERLPYRIFEVALDPGAAIRPRNELEYRGENPIIVSPPPEEAGESSPETSPSGDRDPSSDTDD